MIEPKLDMKRTEPTMTEINITPESLYADNMRSANGIAVYMEAKERGDIYAFETCSDARDDLGFFMGVPAMEARSISAAGQKSHLKFMLGHRGVKAAVFATHIDGETVAPGEIPGGCGGLHARADLEAAIEHVGKDLGKFLAERVTHFDPIIQAYRAAVRASLLTDKPVMTAVVDHRTGLMIPVAILLDGGKNNFLAVHQYYLDPKHYDPKHIYIGDRLPEVDPAYIPPVFTELLEKNRKQVEQIQATDPNFSARQKVQNPSLVTISTSAIPQSTRLSGICAQPNASFVVSLGYQKENGEVTGINRRHTPDALAQALYPLINALDAKSEDDPFGRTHTVLIETPKMEWSRKIAMRLTDYDVTKEWLAKDPRNQIIVGAINLGQYTESLQKL